MSRPGGINTPDHSAHNVGMAWDMRLLRNDNLLQGLVLDEKGNHLNYDRDATKKFIRRTRKIYPEATFYCNDPNLIKEFPGIVSNRPKHWDHIHIMPFLKGRE